MAFSKRRILLRGQKSIIVDRLILNFGDSTLR
jgi:hypothetical protein